MHNVATLNQQYLLKLPDNRFGISLCLLFLWKEDLLKQKYGNISKNVYVCLYRLSCANLYDIIAKSPRWSRKTHSKLFLKR